MRPPVLAGASGGGSGGSKVSSELPRSRGGQDTGMGQEGVAGRWQTPGSLEVLTWEDGSICLLGFSLAAV